MPLTISCPFTFIKGGVFYFSRRIPKELKCHYTSSRISYDAGLDSPEPLGFGRSPPACVGHLT